MDPDGLRGWFASSICLLNMPRCESKDWNHVPCWAFCMHKDEHDCAWAYRNWLPDANSNLCAMTLYVSKEMSSARRSAGPHRRPLGTIIGGDCSQHRCQTWLQCGLLGQLIIVRVNAMQGIRDKPLRLCMSDMAGFGYCSSDCNQRWQ